MVEAVGEQVTYVQPGDHVITCLSVYCGNCEPCLTGHLSLCEDKAAVQRPLDGPQRLADPDGNPVWQFLDMSTFAEQMLDPRARPREDPTKDMPLDKAALIGCGVTTGLGAVFNTAKVEPGATVAVIGCGGIGLNCHPGCRHRRAGSRIIAVDMLDDKLAHGRRLRRDRHGRRGQTATRCRRSRS